MISALWFRFQFHQTYLSNLNEKPICQSVTLWPLFSILLCRRIQIRQEPLLCAFLTSKPHEWVIYRNIIDYTSVWLYSSTGDCFIVNSALRDIHTHYITLSHITIHSDSFAKYIFTLNIWFLLYLVFVAKALTRKFDWLSCYAFPLMLKICVNWDNIETMRQWIIDALATPHLTVSRYMGKSIRWIR